jgi:hypothetical protein
LIEKEDEAKVVAITIFFGKQRSTIRCEALLLEVHANSQIESKTDDFEFKHCLSGEFYHMITNERFKFSTINA